MFEVFLTIACQAKQHFDISLELFASNKNLYVDLLWLWSGLFINRATVVEAPEIWFKDDGNLTKVICEDG